MRLTFSFTIDLDRSDDQPPPREADMGSAVERSESHPDWDRPIGFRRNDDIDPYEEKR